MFVSLLNIYYVVFSAWSQTGGGGEAVVGTLKNKSLTAVSEKRKRAPSVFFLNRKLVKTCTAV